MVKLQLINAAIIYETADMTSRLFWKSFNCRYNPRMNYVPCLITLQSSKKWRSPLFGATGNFNHQILLYGMLFLTFINTNVFYLLWFKFSRKLVKTMAFSFKLTIVASVKTHRTDTQVLKNAQVEVAIVACVNAQDWRTSAEKRTG